MKFNIMKFTLTIAIFVCWPALSTANDVDISTELSRYVDEALSSVCQEDMVSLSIFISDIGQDFLSSSAITCLDLTSNNIRRIAEGAFRKLPNLTNLFLSNNNFDSSAELFNFGNHQKLKVLVLNNAIQNSRSDSKIQIFREYPNLEILSLRKNGFDDMWSPHMDSSKETPLSDSSPLFHFSWPNSLTKNTEETPFPKLKILDISGNNMAGTNFVKLLPNSLYFLDLHDNLFTSLSLNQTKTNLSALNLDNNNLKYVWKRYDPSNPFYQHNKYDPYNRYSNPYDNYDRYNSYNQHNPHNLGLELVGLENLHYLSLSGNKINFIESNTFQNTNKLIYLNLSANNLSDLHPNTFTTLQSLNILDLSLNKFEYVPQMSGETDISILILNCNNIKKLISNAFVQTPKLTKLWLAGNEIDEIDVKAFAHLLTLEKLDLSRNKLSSLPEGWTEPFTSLEYLDLSDNEFTSLDSLPLTNALPLIEVYLAMNPLKYLNAGYFENVSQNLTINLIQRPNLTYRNCNIQYPIE